MFWFRFIISSGSLKLEDLCICPNRFSFSLHVDLVILKDCGGGVGVCSQALFLALNRTRLPVVTPLLSESGEAVDFELDPDVSHSSLLNVPFVPLALSFVQVISSIPWVHYFVF